MADANKESLTSIERVRLALAMNDAGYKWEVGVEEVADLLLAYDNLLHSAESAPSTYQPDDVERLFEGDGALG